MIILEGPNGTGKTTLALSLQKKLREEKNIWCSIVHSDKPNQKTNVEKQILKSLNMINLPVIQDRVPWVSDYVYAPLNANRKSYITKKESRRLISVYSHCIVFCTTSDVKPKSDEHDDNRDVISNRYEELFSDIDATIYDMTIVSVDSVLDALIVRKAI